MDTNERGATGETATPQRETDKHSLDSPSQPVKQSYLELFEQELRAHGIAWCKGECGRNSHRRAYATPKTRTVHMSDKLTQRSVLVTALHEIGHIVANTPGMKRYQREDSATQWAFKRMKELGVSVPQKARKQYARYVDQWKRNGKKISAGLKKLGPPKFTKSDRDVSTPAVIAAKRQIARVQTFEEWDTIQRYLNHRRKVIWDCTMRESARRDKAEAAKQWEAIRGLKPGTTVEVTRRYYSNVPVGTAMEIVGLKKRSLVLKRDGKNFIYGPTAVAKCGLQAAEVAS